MTAHMTLGFTLDAQETSKDSHIYTTENGQRALDWIWATNPQYDEETGEPLPDTPANRQKAFYDWADNMFERFKRDMLNWERSVYANDPFEPIPDP